MLDSGTAAVRQESTVVSGVNVVYTVAGGSGPDGILVHGGASDGTGPTSYRR